MCNKVSSKTNKMGEKTYFRPSFEIPEFTVDNYRPETYDFEHTPPLRIPENNLSVNSSCEKDSEETQINLDYQNYLYFANNILYLNKQHQLSKDEMFDPNTYLDLTPKEK